MEIMKKSIILAAAVLTSSALAQTEESGHKPGFYVQPFVGQFTIDDFCDSTVVDGIVGTSSNCEDSPIGFGLQGGYEFTEFVSAEAGFWFASGFDSDYSLTDGVNTITGSAEGDINVFTLGLRAKYPIHKNVFVLGKAGFGRWATSYDATTSNGISVSTDNDEVELYYGGGGGLSFGQFGATIEYTLIDELSVLSISGIYEF